jgi:hypothetical protein
MLIGQLIASIQLGCTLEMFFGQLTHTKVLESASNHPVEERIVGRELISLHLMSAGLFGFT